MENCQLAKSVRPLLWYKLRVTLDDEKFSPGTSHIPDIKKIKQIQSHAREFVDIILPYVAGPLVSGIEYHDKFGEYTKPHLHVHFKAYAKKDTILKQMKRRYEALFDEVLKGNAMYSFVLETDVDEYRFFRYPLKQYTCLQDIKDENLCYRFDDEKLEDLRNTAHEQYKIACEINDVKKTKKDESSSIYQRIQFSLDKLPAPNPIDIILGIQEIYLKEQRPVNNVTIAGYSNTYMLQKGIISKEDNARKIYSMLNI